MSYNITPILSSEFIGNSLSSTNISYTNLELWTNNITFSSVNYFQPLVNFYLFYKDYWKSTVDYAYSINAPSRLASFKTTVQENSAKWIKPITIFYPKLIEYDSITINDFVNDAIQWFNTQYPVFENDQNGYPNFAEGTTAILNFLTYNINEKADDSFTVTQNIQCSTQDRTARLGCNIIFIDNVTCYGARVCPSFNGTYYSNFAVECLYENNAKSVTRGADFAVDRYFYDRNENDSMGSVLLQVRNCEWQFVKFLANSIIT